MKHYDDYFKGVHQTDVYYQYWLPEDDPKAVILLVHGLVEHSGRYMNMVNYFVPQSYAVYGFDHMGHGKSHGQRTYIDQFKDFTDNIKQYFDLIRQKHQDLPIILFGHSMGALISANYLLDYQSELAAAVLSGPPLTVPNIVSRTMGGLMAKFVPWLGLIRINPDDISRDKAVVQAYIDDPLVFNGRISARLLSEIISGMQRVDSQASTINLPLCIVHGGNDKLADPKGSQLLYERVSSKQKFIKIYDGLYHEVLNEPEYQQVLTNIGEQLDAFVFQT
ncbi:MAG: lysophospholipase [Candidatus Magnetoglobus multicellularis str. Araruama]|uniref:Monoacylglycerol lipase n=1 Tax=Candidatus Magnetoglobus multicellularis str. Araruama TaxID=890399 RepID=A0A1V1P3T0_9BACT|nr:MAG: lysophospholipase [Candidatus Magnetoglobus multicellularis str. Araruama]